MDRTVSLSSVWPTESFVRLGKGNTNRDALYFKEIGPIQIGEFFLHVNRLQKGIDGSNSNARESKYSSVRQIARCTYSILQLS